MDGGDESALIAGAGPAASHPPRLDMLEELSAVGFLIAQDFAVSKVRYRSKRDGTFAQFHFGDSADLMRHPFRLQAEQFDPARVRRAQLKDALHLEAALDTAALEQIADLARFISASARGLALCPDAG